MRPWTSVTAALLALAALACGSPSNDAASDSGWVGTITTEGNTTTVINESGSLAGGASELVAETTIGAEGSGPEYLFGRVRDLATDGERIFVADSQAVVVRVYDLEGRHLMDIGGPGQGPGELQEAKGVGVSPDGRVLVQDDRARKIHVFDAQGAYVESWDRQFRSSSFNGRFTVGDEGPFIVDVLNPDAPPAEHAFGMVLFGPAGRTGTMVEAPQFELPENRRVRYEVEGVVSGVAQVPFVPGAYWFMAPDTTLVSGVANAYELEVRHPYGSVTVVQRRVDPVAVDPEEFAWARDDIVARFRERDPGWTWNGPASPAVKPFFAGLLLGSGGRVWVLRELAGERLPECAQGSDDSVERIERPCWRSPRVFDVFEPDGRFLTTVTAPSRLRTDISPIIEDTMLLVAEEDDFGNVVVKRYRLALPGGEEPG